jgi:hypothetical protein
MHQFTKKGDPVKILLLFILGCFVACSSPTSPTPKLDAAQQIERSAGYEVVVLGAATLADSERAFYGLPSGQYVGWVNAPACGCALYLDTMFFIVAPDSLFTLTYRNKSAVTVVEKLVVTKDTVFRL